MAMIFSLLLFYVIIAFSYGSLVNVSAIIFKKNYRISPLLFPFFGMIFLVSISQSFGYFYGVKYISSILIFIGGMLLIGFVLNFKKDSIDFNYKAINYRLWFFFLLSLIFLIPSLYAGFPTSFAHINNDLIFYLSIPEFLQNHGYMSENISSNLHPFYSIAEIHLSRQSRVGADYFNLLGMNFFNLNALDTFNVISCFFVLLFSLSIYYTSKYCFQFSRSTSWMVTILLSFSSFLYWMFTTQYMPQIAGNAFFILSIGLSYKSIEKKDIKTSVLAGLSLSGMISIYSEYLLYYFLPMGLYCLVIFLKNKKEVMRYIRLVGIIVLVSIVSNPIAFYIALKYNYFAYTSTQNQTGIVDYIPFSNQILMMFGLKLLNYNTPSLGFSILSIVLLIIIFWGLLNQKNNLRMLFMIYTVFIASLLLYLTTVNKFSYGYYKTLLFAFPIILFLFSEGLDKLTGSLFSRINSSLKLLVVSLIVIGNLNNTAILAKGILKEGTVVTQEYKNLREVKNFLPDNIVLLVKGFSTNEEHVIADLLRDTSLYFEGSPSYFAPSRVEEDIFPYTLTPNDQIDIYNSKETLIWRNAKFKITKQADSINIISLKDGWHGIENWNGVPSRWAQRNFNISINSKQKNKIKLSFTSIMPPGVTSRTLEVNINGINKSVVELSNNKLNVIDLKLIEGANQIEFKIKEDSVRVDGDPREFGVGIQNLDFS